jgi:hypothetical protein
MPMRPEQLRRGWLVRRAGQVTALVLAAWTGGCSSDEGGSSSPPPTQIYVDPADFLGDVPCGSQPGAMRSYVVTLQAWDDETDVTPFTLGSSHPTPCSRLVAFRDVVVPGQLYTAEVDGYAELAEQLTPFGQSSSGARRMMDADAGTPVEPRWTTRCGAGPSEGTLARDNESRAVDHCEPLVDSSPSITAIAFPPSVALGADPCALASTLNIVPDSPGLASALGVACDAEPILYDAGIEDGRAYGFYAAANVDGTIEGTECFATARAGLTVTPLCNALSSTGELRITLAGLQADEQELCPAGSHYDLWLDDELLNATPLGCEAEAVVGPLEPGSYALDVTVMDADGEPTGLSATCSGMVVAGRAAPASCSL